MKNLHKNEKGFGAIEAVLVIVIVILIGVVGWLVYKNHHKTTTTTVTTTNSSTTKPSSSSTSTSTQSSNPTADWTSFTSGDGKFSVKYPSTWALPADSSSCLTNQFHVGPTSSSAGSCNPNSSSTTEVTVLDTDHPCGALSSNATTQQVTVSGASGKEYTGSSDGSTIEANTIGPSGTKYIQYCLFATNSGTVYEATYIQLPSYPDVSSDFDLMVTKTLSFN